MVDGIVVRVGLAPDGRTARWSLELRNQKPWVGSPDEVLRRAGTAVPATKFLPIVVGAAGRAANWTAPTELTDLLAENVAVPFEILYELPPLDVAQATGITRFRALTIGDEARELLRAAQSVAEHPAAFDLTSIEVGAGDSVGAQPFDLLVVSSVDIERLSRTIRAGNAGLGLVIGQHEDQPIFRRVARSQLTVPAHTADLSVPDIIRRIGGGDRTVNIAVDVEGAVFAAPVAELVSRPVEAPWQALLAETLDLSYPLTVVRHPGVVETGGFVAGRDPIRTRGWAELARANEWRRVHRGDVTLPPGLDFGVFEIGDFDIVTGAAPQDLGASAEAGPDDSDVRVATAPAESGTPAEADPADEQAASTRTIDVTLADAHGRFVDAFASCRRGARYRLTVGIGRAEAHNLVVGELPPINSFLPPSETGHHLEITFLGRNLEVDGSVRMVPLFLPRYGPAGPVTFNLTFPTVGPAGGRIIVSYLQNTVQTLRFYTTVSEKASEQPSRTTYVQLEHSQTINFELAAITPRAASIILNDSADGSHQIAIKNAQFAGSVDIDPEIQNGIATTIRQKLAAVGDAPLSDERATDIFRDLADVGSQLYRALFSDFETDPMSPGNAVEALSSLSDQVVQIVRVNINHAVPWAFVYDWFLPKGSLAAVEVCFGRAVSPVSGQLEPCAHHAESGRAEPKVLCLRGFWGIRHQIEETFGRKAAAPPRPISAPADHDLIVLGVGATDLDAAAIEVDLRTLLPDRVHRVPMDANLLDRIWDETTRPAMMAVVGHQDLDTSRQWIDGERTRIATGTLEGFFTVEEVLDKRLMTKQPLDQRPLALLLSCQSTVADSRALSSFVKALMKVGFAAVIGTEIIVYTPQVRTFLRIFLEAFVPSPANSGSGVPTLAKAMQVARQQFVLEKKSPYGFAFTSLGPADLSLAV